MASSTSAAPAPARTSAALWPALLPRGLSLSGNWVCNTAHLGGLKAFWHFPATVGACNLFIRDKELWYGIIYSEL